MPKSHSPFFRLILRKRFWMPITYLLLVYLITAIYPPPRAVSLDLPPRLPQNVTFLADISWIDQNGERQIRQQIFDAVFDMVNKAEHLIVIDMFLFNSWQGPVPEQHRALSGELTEVLIAKKQSQPEISITVISDPLNEVYGGLPSTHFEAMREQGINVVLTELLALQDSNPLYSSVWRWLVRPFGNSHASTLPNPLGEGDVSIRSYLALANFKANHRKLIITDAAKQSLQALVMSANPHDGSSAHRNVALQFGGEAVYDLLESERAVLDMSLASDVWKAWPNFVLQALDQRHGVHTPGNQAVVDAVAQSKNQIQILSEAKIRDAVLHTLESAKAGEQIDILMFYLSHRKIVQSIKAAHERGVNVRMLLDVNKDAFGREKKGIPNRPVADELQRAGVAIRWCETQGEQCHAKMLVHLKENTASLLLGSGNYTRRNLDNFNLETNVLYTADKDDNVVLEARAYFDVQWQNSSFGQFSADYELYENNNWWLNAKYRFMEISGLSTF